MDMDATPDEVLRELQRVYPEQVRVCVLTVVNRKQAARITELENQHVRDESGEAYGGNTLFDAVKRDRETRRED